MKTIEELRLLFQPTLENPMSQEAQGTTLIINIVKGGYILQIDGDDVQSEEVFMSTAKLNKAVRTAIDEYTLIPKTKADKAEDSADAE